MNPNIQKLSDLIKYRKLCTKKEPSESRPFLLQSLLINVSFLLLLDEKWFIKLSPKSVFVRKGIY